MTSLFRNDQEEKEAACKSDELCRKIISGARPSRKEIVSAFMLRAGRTVDGKERTRANGKMSGGFCALML